MAFTIHKPIADQKQETLDKLTKLKTVKQSKPIVFQGASWDADATSIAALTTKQLELANKVSLNKTTVDKTWIDSDNIIHTWNTLKQYTDWLQELLIAISERNSSLTSTCRVKKNEVLALAKTGTSKDLVNYNIKSGW